MKILSKTLVSVPSFWYENQSGDKFIPDLSSSENFHEQRPDGYIYQWSRFPNQVNERVYLIEDNLSSKKISSGTYSYHKDLVLAMTRPSFTERLMSIIRTRSLLKKNTILMMLFYLLHFRVNDV